MSCVFSAAAAPKLPGRITGLVSESIVSSAGMVDISRRIMSRLVSTSFSWPSSARTSARAPSSRDTPASDGSRSMYLVRNSARRASASRSCRSYWEICCCRNTRAFSMSARLAPTLLSTKIDRMLCTTS